jgi:hypothetical protein
VARIILEKTNLSANWTILKHVLDISPGEWDGIDGKYPHFIFLLDAVQMTFERWSGSLGLQDATVGRFYDKLREHKHKVVGGYY